MTPAEHKTRLREVVAQLSVQGARRIGYGVHCALQVERWTLIVRLLEGAPFPTRERLARSAQWREAADRVRTAAPCPEMLDWVLLQAEVAQNLERGIRDMRPRKDGPCHALTLEYARKRRGKAEVVLGWADAAIDSGADLSRGPSRVFTSPERAPPKYGNPLARTGSLWQEDAGSGMPDSASDPASDPGPSPDAE